MTIGWGQLATLLFFKLSLRSVSSAVPWTMVFQNRTCCQYGASPMAALLLSHSPSITNSPILQSPPTQLNGSHKGRMNDSIVSRSSLSPNAHRAIGETAVPWGEMKSGWRWPDRLKEVRLLLPFSRHEDVGRQRPDNISRCRMWRLQVCISCMKKRPQSLFLRPNGKWAPLFFCSRKGHIVMEIYQVVGKALDALNGECAASKGGLRLECPVFRVKGVCALFPTKPSTALTPSPTFWVPRSCSDVCLWCLLTDFGERVRKIRKLKTTT